MSLTDPSVLVGILPAALLIYYLLPLAQLRMLWLLAVSLGGYAWATRGSALPILLLLLQILFSYYMALLMQHQRSRAGLYYRIAVAGTLGWLLLFKYAGAALSTLDAALPGLSVPAPDWAFPVGLSFYTFQTISYLTDVRRGTVPASTSLLRYGTFLAMFPKLVSGPLVRYGGIAPQLDACRVTGEEIGLGLRRLILGLAAKTLLADPLGGLWRAAETIGYDSLSTPLAWMALVGFSLQLYFDFWGYSLMAQGLGQMLGFGLPRNFDCPYLARSMTDFWRRWHITLGAWFRDYVYIPLGGSRRGRAVTARNLLTVWLLTGIWHGTGWTYLAWGILLFLLIWAEKGAFGRLLAAHPHLARVYMTLAIPLSWLPFAASSLGGAAVYLGRLFPLGGSAAGPFPGDWVKYGQSYGLLLLAGLLCATRLPERFYRRYRARPWMLPLLLALLALCLWRLLRAGNDPFLYAQF